jgi:hypothetical protein
MNISVSRFILVSLAGVVVCSGMQSSQTYQGLEVKAVGVERATRVSLQDCPPGANIVKGVIRPTEDNEFATIQLDVKVLPSFDGGEIPKPVLYDDAGNEYKTAQSFRDVSSQDAYTCNFSFRLPKGTKLTRVAIDDTSLDISDLEK